MIDPKRCFEFDLNKTDEGFTTTFFCKSDLPYLEGHFPNHPVMPAVALIDASLVIVECYGRKISNVESAKFSGPIEPGMKIEIAGQFKNEVNWVVTWKHNDQTLAELRLTLE